MNDPIGEGEIVFYIGNGNTEVLRISPNGDFYVRGKLTTNDMEVYNALRDFLNMGHSPIPKTDKEIRKHYAKHRRNISVEK